jgi:hypothetical protein
MGLQTVIGSSLNGDTDTFGLTLLGESNEIRTLLILLVRLELSFIGKHT